MKILFLISMIAACFLSGCNVKEKSFQEIHLTQLSLLEPGQDATPIVADALAGITRNAHIILPRGKYTFFPIHAPERYFMISNNDNGVYRIAFDLAGKENIVIDGQGSELVFEGLIIPFNLEDVTNITLKNFSIDWNRPFHGEGHVVSVDPSAKTFDNAVSDEFPYRLEGEQLIWVPSWDVNEWDRNIYRQDIGVNLFFDPSFGGTAYRVKEHKMNPYYPLLHTQYTAREIERGRVRIYNRISELPEPGWVWVSKGQLQKARTSPAIRMLGAKDVVLENINIYHAGAMGIIAERSEDISLDNVNVMLPPGKNRIVSATADATHFVNCRGHISITNSLFENMLDDATNIHGTYLRIGSVPDEYTVGVHAVHDQQNVQRWAEPGDMILFRGNETMEVIRELPLKEFRFVNELYALMVFDEKVSDLPARTAVENPAWNPTFEMRNCIVRNNRARSILLSSNQRMVIENNTFIHPMMAAISIAGDLNYWFESGNVTGLIIRDNHFIDGSTGGFGQALITFEPIILNPESRKHPFHANVTIEKNVFETFDNAILDAFSVKNLVFMNNTIKPTQTFPKLFPEHPAINLRFVENVTIQGNVFKGDDHAYIYTHEESVIGLVVDDNKGFLLQKSD